MRIALRRWRQLPRLVRIAAGSVLVPALLLGASRVQPNVTSIIAAEIIYLWTLLARWSQSRLRRRFGSVTGTAALAVLAAVSTAPLGLLGPGCSDALSSPYCHREVAGWAAAGIAATIAIVAITAVGRIPPAVTGLKDLVVTLLRRNRTRPPTLALSAVRRPLARQGRARRRQPKTFGQTKRRRRRT